MKLRLGRALWSAGIIAAIVFGFGAARSSAQQTSNSAPAKILRLKIDGEIEPILADYITHGIDAAAEQHDDLVLITIDTPGGLDTSMRAIIQKILVSPVPVVVYVSPTGARAASAGFFILLSADVAAMSPGTDTGAASPVVFVGRMVDAGG